MAKMKSKKVKALQKEYNWYKKKYFDKEKGYDYESR